VERGPENIDILVQDNGPGLSDEEKEKAFLRFYRGPGAIGTGIEGTGLGLPIVLSIMKAHGGSAVLMDGKGGGLCVRLRFPASLRSVPKSDNLKDVKSA
jgi:signal transduction histidine kinase